MRWSIKIARIAGIDVKIHITFLLLLAWIGFAYHLQGGASAAWEGVLFILLLFASVLLHEFPVVDDAMRVQGILTRDDLIAALTRGGPHQPITTAMRTDLPMVSSRTAFEEAFQRMQESQSPVLPVTDDYGRLVGMITPENVGEMMMVHSALSRGQHPPGWLGPRGGVGGAVVRTGT